MGPELIQVGSARERDQVYRVLADERRRAVLTVLESADASIAVADLALDLVRREHDVDSSDERHETAERLRLSLYHCHLPMLADVGLVDYDPDRQVVGLPDDLATDDLELITTER